ncbi:hypothetical protein BI364_06550 [Acidihalobacter yilgarnensis]|uniref:ACT domain-containing protein n=1 Tax=Acidihalobacter yilgarnensis TaxID=2819280 RepID=A0A1D8IMM1_9GAMM|nr:hypothetical protein [Acidihalobacter yilgarnensis]AOU97661.1 hypothetical protein BI364_06550 [Acidihalobacter yilgarnensis]
MSTIRWVLRIRVEDRTGVLARISAVCTYWAISLQLVQNSETEQPGEAAILLGFAASERKAKLLMRHLRRLESVREIVLLPHDEPTLRATTTIQLTDGAHPHCPADVDVHALNAEGRYLLIGSLYSVETCLNELRHRGLLHSAGRALIAL